MTEIEHELFYIDFIDLNYALKQHYVKYGYNIDDSTDAAMLGNMCRAYSNTVLSMTPYMNEYTVDVLPRAGFKPDILSYLDRIPVPTGDPDFR